MIADRNPAGGVLRTELPLLLFHAAGVALGVEAAMVEGILDTERAWLAGIACSDLAVLLGSAPAVPPRAGKQLVLRSREVRCGIGIDSLDDIVTVSAAALQPLPAPLSYFRHTGAFWAGIVREDRVVLLVAADRLLEAARATRAGRGTADGPISATCQ